MAGALTKVELYDATMRLIRWGLWRKSRTSSLSVIGEKVDQVVSRLPTVLRSVAIDRYSDNTPEPVTQNDLNMSDEDYAKSVWAIKMVVSNADL
jgi:hypothetical protein